MLVVHVHLKIKPECIEDFKALCIYNASQSLQEPGIARFDFVQQQDDPTRFVLVEAYKNPDAPAAHKQTAHYLRFKEEVEPMQAEARYSLKYDSLYPVEADW